MMSWECHSSILCDVMVVSYVMPEWCYVLSHRGVIYDGMVVSYVMPLSCHM